MIIRRKQIYRTKYIRYRISDIVHQISYIRYRTSDIVHQISYIKTQSPTNQPPCCASWHTEASDRKGCITSGHASSSNRSAQTSGRKLYQSFAAEHGVSYWPTCNTGPYSGQYGAEYWPASYSVFHGSMCGQHCPVHRRAPAGRCAVCGTGSKSSPCIACQVTSVAK
jgi:hypothetical protein